APRQSTIAGADAAAERVHRRVEPARGEIKPERRRRGLAEHDLSIDREVAMQDVLVRLRRTADDLVEQWHQLTPDIRADTAHLAAGRPRFIFVEQGVVRALAVADRFRLLTLQIDDLLQPRRERGEVVLLAGLLPDVLGPRRHACQLFDEAGRDLDSS